MKNQQNKLAPIKAPMGHKSIVRVTRTGSFVQINPPPVNMCCEICGRNVVDLQPFDQDFCEINEECERRMFDEFPNSRCTFHFITTDHKLVKKFRRFDEIVGSSWECKECFFLSDEETTILINNNKILHM